MLPEKELVVLTGFIEFSHIGCIDILHHNVIESISENDGGSSARRRSSSSFVLLHVPFRR